MFKNNSQFILKFFIIIGVIIATLDLDFKQRLGIIFATISLLIWLETSFKNLKDELTDSGDNENL